MKIKQESVPKFLLNFHVVIHDEFIWFFGIKNQIKLSEWIFIFTFFESGICT